MTGISIVFWELVSILSAGHLTYASVHGYLCNRREAKVRKAELKRRAERSLPSNRPQSFPIVVTATDNNEDDTNGPGPTGQALLRDMRRRNLGGNKVRHKHSTEYTRLKDQ